MDRRFTLFLLLGLVGNMSIASPKRPGVTGLACPDLFSRLKISYGHSPERDSRLLAEMQRRVQAEEAGASGSSIDPSDLTLFQRDPQRHLSHEERGYISEYLRNSAVNLALRGHVDSSFNPVKLEPFQKMIASLDQALWKLNNFNGICFRGHALEVAEIEEIERAGSWVDPGFVSSSLDYWRAMGFSRSRFSRLKDVLMVIKSKNGHVVPEGWYHRKEREVVFSRGTRFRVLKVDKTVHPVLIYLEEF